MPKAPHTALPSVPLALLIILLLQGTSEAAPVYQANATATDGPVSLTWPKTDFELWCTNTGACASQPSVNYSLVTSNWTSTQWNAAVLAQAVSATAALSGNATITAVRAVSDLADISVLPASIKSDTNICSAAQPCEALLTFSLRNITTQDPLLCVRLVRSGAGYTITGYPAGTGGLRIAVPATSANVTCGTTQLGPHAVIQFTRVVIPPPPRPPSPPPPPPMARDTGKAEVPVGPVSISFSITYALDFNTLVASDVAIATFTTDTSRYLAQGLAAIQPSLFANAANTLPYYDRLTLQSINPGSVTAVYKVALPDGVQEAQIDDAVAAIKTDPSFLLVGSAYQTYVLSSKVISVDGQTGKGLPLWLILLIVASSVTFIALATWAVAVLIRRKLRAGVTPEGAPTNEKPKKKKTKKLVGTDVEADQPGTPIGPWVGPPTPHVPPNSAAPSEALRTPIAGDKARAALTPPPAPAPPAQPSRPPGAGFPQPPGPIYFVPMVAAPGPAPGLVHMVPLNGFGQGPPGMMPGGGMMQGPVPGGPMMPSPIMPGSTMSSTMSVMQGSMMPNSMPTMPGGAMPGAAPPGLNMLGTQQPQGATQTQRTSGLQPP